MNLLHYCSVFCLLLMFWFFGQEARGILAAWSGIEPTPPVLEGDVFTAGLSGKSEGQTFKLVSVLIDFCVKWNVPSFPILCENYPTPLASLPLMFKLWFYFKNFFPTLIWKAVTQAVLFTDIPSWRHILHLFKKVCKFYLLLAKYI